MVYRIACPIQQSDTFSIGECFNCRHFNLSKGKHITVSCRKNRTAKHKRDFEGAYFSDRLRIPDTVEVEEKEETQYAGNEKAPHRNSAGGH